VTLAYHLQGVTQRRDRETVLDVERLDIERGAILGLTGPNGSGKSTLLRLLAFLDAPAAGSLAFMGQPVLARDAALRRRVALLEQSPYLLKRSVAGNVAYGLTVRGERDIAAKVDAALAMVGLAPERFLRRSWRELSGGEAQRVALAARLVLRPEAILLDEPTTHLDAESADRIMSAATLARERWSATVIVVSHDLPWIEGVCDRAVRLAHGRLA